MATCNRKVDPEPITIFMAIMATYAASVASLNYVKSHHKPLPSRTRYRVLSDVNKISALIHEIRLDLSTVREIFASAEFVQERTIKLGNGALLSYEDFSLYQRVSANVFQNLARTHKLCLDLEKHALRHDGLDMSRPTNELGAAYELFEYLWQNKNLAVEEAWEHLEQFAELIQASCNGVRRQLQ